MQAISQQVLARITKKSWALSLLVVGLLLSSPILAFEFANPQERESKTSTYAEIQSRGQYFVKDNNGAYTRSVSTADSLRRSSRPFFADSLAADSKPALKSRSEVVREVKRRYNARVIKISLNGAKTMYRVRILLPSGKVRNISVNAKK